MAWTQSDVDALKAAIATGARRARMSNGEEVEYRSLDEMRTALRLMEAEVAGQTGAAAQGFAVTQPRMGRGL